MLRACAPGRGNRLLASWPAHTASWPLTSGATATLTHPKGYRFEYAGEDLAAIVDALDLPQPRVIGHSSGGLATIIAANLLPNLFGPVVLVETRVSNDAATAPAQDLNRRAERTRMKRSVWESRAAMFDGYRDRAAFKDWQDEPYREFIEGGTRLLSDGRAS